jgi:membrane protein DedA with SNARE-associated domain
VIGHLLDGNWSGDSLGYPLMFGLVLLGSIVPVVPTGAVVGAGAAVATTTDHLSLTLVVLVSALAALVGDLVTFAVSRFGGPSAVRWVARGQHADRIEEVRGQFRRHGWQIVVVGRLLPAGRIPVLLAAGALAYPWRRLLPASAVACLLWAVAYAALGVLSGGIFDSPLLATLLATLLILVLGGVLNLVSSRRRRRKATEPAPEPSESP